MGKLLDQAREIGAPIVENGKVTFVWEGEHAPDLIADFTGWNESPIRLTKAGAAIKSNTGNTSEVTITPPGEMISGAA